MPALGLSIRLRYRISSQDNSNARTAWVHFFTWHSWHSEVSLWPWVQECFLKDKKSLCLKPLSKGPTRSAVTVWQLYLFSLLVINYCFNQFHFILGPIKGSCTKKDKSETAGWTVLLPLYVCPFLPYVCSYFLFQTCTWKSRNTTHLAKVDLSSR